MNQRSRKKRKIQIETLEGRQLLTGIFKGEVWHDAHRDGQREGELDYEVADVSVNLLDPSGNVVASQRTKKNGKYEFSNVPEGKYIVEFKIPQGTLFTQENAAPNSRDSDVLTSNGHTKRYTLRDGEVQGDVDAGIYSPFESSSIRGFVWEDTNGNGIFEPNERKISDAEVQIENIHVKKLFDVRTDSNGTFFFDGQHLLPGDYVLDFVRPVHPDLPPDVPNRLSASPIPLESIDPETTNFASPENGKTEVFTVAAGSPQDEPNDIVMNGGFFLPTSIIGEVFHDFDRDGLKQGKTEFGLNDIRVKLLDADLRIVDQAFTDKSGDFAFRSVPAGEYYVEYETGPDLIPNHPKRTDKIQLTSGKVVELVGHGLYSENGTHSITGFVWEDLNADGIYADHEPKRKHHQLQLQNIKFKSLFEVTADENGEYFVDGSQLLPGDYVVSFANEADLADGTNLRISPRNVDSTREISTVDNDIQPTNGNTRVIRLGSHTVRSERQEVRLDGAFFELSTVSGMVWQDDDKNGIHEDSERYVSDLEVRLLDPDDHEVSRTFTVNGVYVVEDVYPGKYRVEFEEGQGAVYTSPNVDSSSRSDVFTVTSDSQIEIDAGIIGTQREAAVTGFIWNDQNGDGIQDDNEPGMEEITVMLIGRDESVVKVSASNHEGRYEFEDIDPGEYSLRVKLPNDAMISPFRRGNDSDSDSDINRWIGRTPFFSIVDGQTRDSVDVGIYSGPISDDSVSSIRVTEIGFIGHGNPEFAEIKNIGDVPVDLSDVQFVDGVFFDFGSSIPKSIFPGELAIVIGDKQRLSNEYNLDEINVAGEYEDDLGRNERITLVKGKDQTITDFKYDHEWFIIMDNEYLPWTLTIVDEDADVTSWNTKTNWRPSSKLAGTPGIDDPKFLPDPGTIVVNEVLTKSSDGRNDLIEIHNRSDKEIDISHWYIGDSERELEPLIYLTRYRIAPGTVIPAGGFLVFSREDHFGNPSDPGVNFPFGLSSFGEAVHLIAADQFGRMQGYSDSVSFDGSQVDVSFGRIDSGGHELFTALSESTFGGPNHVAPKIESIIIDQVMYHPNEHRNEYVRLKNIGESPVDLSVGFQPWRLSNAINFVFEDDALILPDEHFLVVNDDPEEFRRRLEIPSHLQIFGPYENKLSNRQDEIRLYRYLEDGRKIRVDQVDYRDSAPWPTEADLGDIPLTRISTLQAGNDPSNWVAQDLSETRHLERGIFVREFAKINDRTVFAASFLGRELWQAAPGDSDGDGAFNSNDLVQIFQHAKYDTGSPADWTQGDWTGDGLFDSNDLVLAFQSGGYQTAAHKFGSSEFAALIGSREIDANRFVGRLEAGPKITSSMKEEENIQ